MTLDPRATIAKGPAHGSAVSGTGHGTAAKAMSATPWSFQQSIKPRQSGLGDIAEASRHYGIRDGYLDHHCTAATAGESKIPVIWCDRLMRYSMHSWNDAGKHELKPHCDLKPRFFRWRHAGLKIQATSTLQDVSPDWGKGSLVSGPQKLRWLVQMTHVAFSRLVRDKNAATSLGLTERELEVMKWTADGKSAQDVADILLVSKHTVDFHIKNSVAKLEAPNKTAAVVRAALLGLLT